MHYTNINFTSRCSNITFYYLTCFLDAHRVNVRIIGHHARSGHAALARYDASFYNLSIMSAVAAGDPSLLYYKINKISNPGGITAVTFCYPFMHKCLCNISEAIFECRPLSPRRVAAARHASGGRGVRPCSCHVVLRCIDHRPQFLFPIIAFSVTLH